jgi:hypothetical protein
MAYAGLAEIVIVLALLPFYLFWCSKWAAVGWMSGMALHCRLNEGRIRHGKDGH